MKKIISIITICLLIFTFAGCTQSADKKSVNNSEKNTVSDNNIPKKTEADKENTEEKKKQSEKEEAKDVTVVNDGTMASQSRQKVVVIDPGHGMNGNKEMEPISPNSKEMKIKDPGGAQGTFTGVPEYKVTLQVAMKLKEKLEANNVKVVMTKTTDAEAPGNIERAETANKINADLQIRIHCDSAENSNAHGASMLVPGDAGYSKSINAVSRTYGEIILTNLVQSAGMYNRGISVRNDLTGFNWSKVPIVLVEMGFMSNKEEDMKLNNDDYQNKLADGLCNGIIKALNEK